MTFPNSRKGGMPRRPVYRSGVIRVPSITTPKAASAGPALRRAHQSRQRHRAARLRGNLEVTQVDYGTLTPVRQGQPPNGDPQRAQDAPLPLDDKAGGASDGAEESRVILAVRNAEEAP